MCEKPELLITVCSHRTLAAPTAGSFDQLRFSDIPWLQKLVVGDALISRSRSAACTHFLEDELQLPYMLFIDDDITFTPQDVGTILTHLKNGYDIIGGIYAVRGASQLSSYGYNGRLDVDGKIHEIEYLSTGFMGISRRALEKIKAELKLPELNKNDWSRNFPFFECGRCLNTDEFAKTLGDMFKTPPSDKFLKRWLKFSGFRVREKGDSIYISEDWDFCDKARLCGIKIYADTSVQVGHMREQIFTPENVLGVQQQQWREKTIHGAQTNQMNLIQKIDEDLSEFLAQPVNKIREQMNTAQKDLAEEWDDSGERFYEKNTTYLFDLALFNKQEDYFRNRLGQLVNISKLKILDIGCGIGTTAFMMSEQGNDVTGWDINEDCIDFCNFKKDKYKLGGTFTTEKPDFSEFDFIIAVDTLEHIKDLKGFLKDLGTNMKYGAKFYHSDFFPKENAWPMHYEEHAKSLDKWLGQAGLIVWDGRWCIRGQ